MPAWISVYCQQKLGEVEPKQLRNDILQNDYFTLAEQYDIDEALVALALTALRIVPDNGGYEVHYAAESDSNEQQLRSRPVVIHIWESPDRVQEEIEEVLECLNGASGYPTALIEQHLSEVQAVAGIDIGASQFQNMGIVFAYEIARWFGKNRTGLINDVDENWSLIENGGFVHL